MVKLTPPEYLNVKDELAKINLELNILSGEIKLMQNDLIELGMDIKKEGIFTVYALKNLTTKD